jgi:hypothetical protein
MRFFPFPTAERYRGVSSGARQERLWPWLPCLLACGIGCSLRSAPAAERLSAVDRAAVGISAQEAATHVHALADDVFEGREGGSRGGRAAGNYVEQAVARLGLEPAGDGGSFFQSFGRLRNILALAAGSDPDRSEELVVIGAHYDHVGYGNPRNSFGPFGFVHNGADDNASGVAGLLEIAEAVASLGERPRRPILFAFWDGEEKGLLGSYHFLRVRPIPLQGRRIVFAINLDMIGRLRSERVEVFGSRTAVGLRQAVAVANNRPAIDPLHLFFDWTIKEDSDHYPFIAASIPTVMFHTGLHDDYHRPSDDVHLVNLSGIEPVSRLAFEFLIQMANTPGSPYGFRFDARRETDAQRRGLEAAAVAGSRGRWGLGTRFDAGEPSRPIVVHVRPDSPADRAGMKIGDRVASIDQVPLTSQQDMVEKFQAAGTTAMVEIERAGRFIPLRFEDSQ